MTKNDFITSVEKLLIKNKQVLTFLRIPNSGFNRHYFFIESLDDLNNLLKESNTSDSITIFKTINTIDTGIVTKSFINNLLETTDTTYFNPELVIIYDTFIEYHKNGDSKWNTVESIGDLKDILADNIGEHITLIEEPDFCDEQNTFHIYAPDRHGISKPGNSY